MRIPASTFNKSREEIENDSELETSDIEMSWIYCSVIENGAKQNVKIKSNNWFFGVCFRFYRRFIFLMEPQAKKALDKLEKKALLEQEKRKKPGECLKVENIDNFIYACLIRSVCLQYIRVIVDQKLANEPMGNRIIPSLYAINVKCELKEQLAPRTLYWQRNVQQTFANKNDVVRR